jgi:pimeloyl-ACP methyl ester carboxylesterase
MKHPEAEKKNSGRRLKDEAYLGFLDMLVFNLPRPGMVKASVLVLGGARDYVFSPSEVEATERAYKTQPETFADMPHDMMLEPIRLANRGRADLNLAKRKGIVDTVTGIPTPAPADSGLVPFGGAT